jgi:large subunit ribosomal protein L22
MARTKEKTTIEEKKVVNVNSDVEEKKNKSVDEKKVEEKKTEETKKSEDSKKADKKSPKIQRNDASVYGRDLAIGKKHAVAICNFIRNKNIDVAIELLEDVVKYKRAVPMRGEIPHRKGRIMSGRYPIKAAQIYIKLLKSLKANAINGDLELEKFKIYAMPNKAARPYKRFGQGRFKRTHVLLKLIPKNKEGKK